MKLGAHAVNWGPWATAETIARLGERAEALGFDSIWVADHVVVPSRIESEYPFRATGPFSREMQNVFEPVGVLTFLAGRTHHIQLGTSVLVVPMRPPVLLAKQWATLDALSGGRTILGVGSGWMREEFEALGVATFERRGLATDDALRIFRAVWSAEDEVSFEGRVHRFEPLTFLPKPARPGGPPIWIGGHGRRSIRRAAELGDGWHVFRMDLDELRAGTAILHEQLAAFGRRPEDVTLSAVLAVYAPGRVPAAEPRDFELVGEPERMAEALRRYQAAGVEHVVLNVVPRDSAAAVLETYEYVARDVKPLI